MVLSAKAWGQERARLVAAVAREETVLPDSNQRGKWREARSGSRCCVLLTLGLSSQSMEVEGGVGNG